MVLLQDILESHAKPCINTLPICPASFLFSLPCSKWYLCDTNIVTKFSLPGAWDSPAGWQKPAGQWNLRHTSKCKLLGWCTTVQMLFVASGCDLFHVSHGPLEWGGSDPSSVDRRHAPERDTIWQRSKGDQLLPHQLLWAEKNRTCRSSS